MTATSINQIKDGMTLEEIQALVLDELEVKTDNLDSEVLRQPKIFALIQRLHMLATRRLEVLLGQQIKLKMNRVRFYTGKLPPDHYRQEPLTESILKTDVDFYVKSDSKTIEMSNLVGEQERIVKFLEDAKQQLKDRGYTIRCAIDFMRLTTVGV